MKRVLSILSRRVDIFAVIYLAGVVVMVSGGTQKEFWLPFIRTVLWVVGFPGAFAYGVLIGKTRRDDSPMERLQNLPPTNSESEIE